MLPSYRRFVLATLSYSAVFQYPLLIAQIWRYFIWQGNNKAKFKLFLETIEYLFKTGKIYRYKNYLTLKKNYSWVRNRIRQEKIARKKTVLAQKTAKLLSLLPSIELIGLSGKLAMGIAQKNDDIDLLIITKTQTIWLTRLTSLIILFLMGRKRNPSSQHTADKVCLNMWMDRAHLQIPQNEQDLFSAHEIAQMKLLFQRNNCYDDFISSNLWIKNFLPNAAPIATKTLSSVKNLSKRNHRLLSTFESLAGAFQLKYMKNKMTSEVVSPGYLRFHPNDARSWILPEFNKLVTKVIKSKNQKIKGSTKHL